MVYILMIKYQNDLIHNILTNIKLPYYQLSEEERKTAGWKYEVGKPSHILSFSFLTKKIVLLKAQINTIVVFP